MTIGELDNAVPMALAKRLKMRQWKLGLKVLEGGSIDVNGAGLLMTTEECLLSDVHGYAILDWPRAEIEEGASEIIWARIRWYGWGGELRATTRMGMSTIWRDS